MDEEYRKYLLELLDRDEKDSLKRFKIRMVCRSVAIASPCIAFIVFAILASPVTFHKAVVLFVATILAMAAIGIIILIDS